MYICIRTYTHTCVYTHITCDAYTYGEITQGRAVQSHGRGPDHPEGEHLSRWLSDFSVGAVPQVVPYDISLRCELGVGNHPPLALLSRATTLSVVMPPGRRPQSTRAYD